MARLSDSIEEFIKAMLDEDELDTIEIQRNELAGHFKCVPSQINYVISTRFSPEKGYMVESRRGGGGYIKICRVRVESSKEAYLMHSAASIGDEITQHHAEIFIKNFVGSGMFSERDGIIAEAVTSDKALSSAAPDARDRIRADILRRIILSMVSMID
ncbi:MAG: CtsR family transcriptional regulator [Clostridia bacterium]|nr:CtsR family transcriptional regulator [Clostridia bacterium]